MSLQVILAREAHFRTFTPRDGADRTGLRLTDMFLDIFRMSGGNVTMHVSGTSSTMNAGVNWALDGRIVDSHVSTEWIRLVG